MQNVRNRQAPAQRLRQHLKKYWRLHVMIVSLSSEESIANIGYSFFPQRWSLTACQKLLPSGSNNKMIHCAPDEGGFYVTALSCDQLMRYDCTSGQVRGLHSEWCALCLGHQPQQRAARRVSGSALRAARGGADAGEPGSSVLSVAD